jgi:hypothetical protein
VNKTGSITDGHHDRGRGGEVRHADVCIIGSGPAGLSLAHELIGSGYEVLVLESGGDNFDVDADALNAGEPSDSRFAALGLYRRRIVGGASVIWGGRCVPYDPIDLEARPERGGFGWPFGIETLEAYYDRAAAYCEIGAPEFDARHALPPAGPFIEGLKSEVLRTTSFERFSPPTNFGRLWGRAIRRSTNVKIETDATCTSLVFGVDGKTVERARVARRQGADFEVVAGTFVVACGGIETYRLLAVSTGVKPSDPEPPGALGRYFMSHIEGSIAQLRLLDPKTRIEWGFPRSRDGVDGRRRITIAPEVQRRAGLLNFVMRLHHPAPVDPRHGNAILSAMLLAKSFILPEYRRKITMLERSSAAAMPQGLAFWAAHLRNIVLGAPSLLAFLCDWTVRRYLVYRRIPYVALKSAKGVYPIDFHAEQTPNPACRLRLIESVDRFGTPLAAVDWRMNDADIASIAANFRTARDAFATTGVAVLDFDDEALEDRIRQDAVPVGGHHLGMARMSDDPEHGVVDANLRMHGVDNAYVVGGAVLPTSGHANPTFTIVALAVRLADHLKSVLRPGD